MEPVADEIQAVEEFIIVYPTYINKYTGNIRPTLYETFQTVIICKKRHIAIHKTFNTYDEALEFHKLTSNALGLTKNIIKQYPDRLEVAITKGLHAICDVDQFDLVQNHCLYATSEGYAATSINGRTVLFHHLVMNFVPQDDGMSIDHINRNKLDNRKTNLRVADRHTQIINRGTNKNNTTGTKGVNPYKGGYEAKWSTNGRQHTKTFSIKKHGDKALELAVAYRKAMETKYYQ